MVQPKNETGDLLASIFKNCEMLTTQTHRKAQDTLEFKLTKPRENISFNPSINLGLDSKWMIRLTSLEVYNSIFNTTLENIKFKLFTDLVDEFSHAQLKDSVAVILGLSDISSGDLQNEKDRPYFIKTYGKLATEKKQTDGYYVIIRLCSITISTF